MEDLNALLSEGAKKFYISQKAINRVHPIRKTDRESHAIWEAANAMVTERVEKAELVKLVNFLLHERKTLRDLVIPVEAVNELDELLGLFTCYLQKYGNDTSTDSIISNEAYRQVRCQVRNTQETLKALDLKLTNYSTQSEI